MPRELVLDGVPVLARVDGEEHALGKIVERLEELALLLRVRVVGVLEQDRRVHERHVLQARALLKLKLVDLAAGGRVRGRGRRGVRGRAAVLRRRLALGERVAPLRRVLRLLLLVDKLEEDKKIVNARVQEGVHRLGLAEGFEAGGHNGREETTTMCLVPAVSEALDVPVIAAGGIGDSRSILAAFALGAEGVQIGSRFVATDESSAHHAFKERVIAAKEGDTALRLKPLTPVRLLDNAFAQQVAAAEANGLDLEALSELLGRGRAKRGMFEGDLEEGELEIGQVSGTIDAIVPAAQVMEELVQGYHALTHGMTEPRFRW